MKEVLLGGLFMVALGSSMMIVAASCEKQSEIKQGSQEPAVLSKDTENYHQRVTEYTYEGCEYIKVGYGKSIWGSHKGNCKNPIHKGQHPSPYIIDIPDQTIIVEDTTINKID